MSSDNPIVNVSSVFDVVSLQKHISDLEETVKKLSSSLETETHFRRDLANKFYESFNDISVLQTDFNNLNQFVDNQTIQIKELQTQFINLQSNMITHDEVRFVVEDLMVEYELIDEIEEDPLQE